MDWIVHGVAKNWWQLSDFHFHSYIADKILHRLSHREALVSLKNKFLKQELMSWFRMGLEEVI